MTPEERFTKIEKALQSVAETQARHEAIIDKHNAAIRDLIITSRTLIDSQREVTNQIQELSRVQSRTVAEMGELREAQKHTDEKLNALIDTVDRIVRRIELR
jgi:uncharacterized coiled-coil DUF342 family protein